MVFADKQISHCAYINDNLPDELQLICPSISQSNNHTNIVTTLTTNDFVGNGIFSIADADCSQKIGIILFQTLNKQQSTSYVFNISTPSNNGDFIAEHLCYIVEHP